MFLLAQDLLNIGGGGGGAPNSIMPYIVRALKWFCFLIGYGVGTLIMKLYSWLFNWIYTFSTDSNVALAVCVLGLTAADALAGPIVSPSLRLQEAPLGEILPLRPMFVMLVSASLISIGPSNTLGALAFFVSTLHAYEADEEYKSILRRFSSPAARERMNRDPEFVRHVSNWLMVPLTRFGGAVSCGFLALRWLLSFCRDSGGSSLS